MSKLRRLSAKDLIYFFERQGFFVVRQKGSHIILRRVLDGVRQHLIIPNHGELDRGTSHAIYKQASVYMDDHVLREVFFTN